jgi:hypothetical protein
MSKINGMIIHKSFVEKQRHLVNTSEKVNSKLVYIIIEKIFYVDLFSFS